MHSDQVCECEYPMSRAGFSRGVQADNRLAEPWNSSSIQGCTHLLWWRWFCGPGGS